jgi:hypothetical protein
MNTTVADSVGYTPVELMYNQSRPDLFVKLLNKTKDQNPDVESLQERITKAYTRMKEKAIKRNKKKKKGSTVWEPRINDEVLLRCQHNSDAVQGVTRKFVQNYGGPWLIYDIILPSIYELSDMQGKIRGRFNKASLKPYLREPTID